jgi:hypothetical protein
MALQQQRKSGHHFWSELGHYGSRRALLTARTTDRRDRHWRTSSPQLASFSRIDTFFRTAFSAYTRVIADVASVPVRGRRSKHADVRRSNANWAINIMGCGGNARIGVVYGIPRGYMARASRSGSCEHGYSDQRSQQKFGFSHFLSPCSKPVTPGYLITRLAAELPYSGTRQLVFEHGITFTRVGLLPPSTRRLWAIGRY